MVYNKTRQQITCGISVPSRDLSFSTSFVYASNHRHEKRRLWEKIENLASDTPLRSSPWIVLGDFNQMLNSSEHSRRKDYEILSGGAREFRR